MIRRLIIKIRDYRLRKWRERIWNIPKHEVVETKESVYIDGKRISHVLSPNGVKVDNFGNNQKIVTISFVAKSYRKQS